MSTFHRAKELPPDTAQDVINGLTSKIKDIGRQFLDLGIKKAGTYLINCADNLFTAVTNPGMSFTNNIAESAIRPVVIRRKTIYRYATIRGARLYCVIASNLATWKKQGRNPDEELLRLFNGG